MNDLDRKVAHAMGLKSVNNCEKWGTSMTQEALKLALEFIENSECGTADLEARIKEALAQTQEPFAYVNIEKRKLEFAHDYVKWDTPTTVKLERIPLYTTPPQRTWVGLTNEEVYELYDHVQAEVNEHWEKGGTTMMFPPTLYKAIEAKLKEKNT